MKLAEFFKVHGPREYKAIYVNINNHWIRPKQVILGRPSPVASLRLWPVYACGQSSPVPQSLAIHLPYVRLALAGSRNSGRSSDKA